MAYYGVNNLLEHELLGGTFLKTRHPAIGDLQPEFTQCRACCLFFITHCCWVRFFVLAQNASHHKMLLQPPKRLPAGGYFLALNPPVVSPTLVCDASAWVPTEEWSEFATTLRNQLVGELLSHGNWFSRPPRRDVIEPLFAPWVGKSMQGGLQFSCQLPPVSGPGSAKWRLEGLTMSASAISPNWTVVDFVAGDEDKISLFGDANTVDEDDEREIQFDDIELASPAAAPTRMRNREWEAAKFLAKERVREARLKAQIADRLAAKEESRFYAKFGDLDDSESHFSEYDLTEDEDEVASSDSP